MATGLLILGLDSSTRLLTYLVGLPKVYEATIRLGFATTTDDSEGEALGAPVDTSSISPEAIAVAIVPLTGEIQQVPSSVSAIKVDGKRSYDRVRAGEEFTLAARTVTVTAFDVLEVRGSSAIDLDVRVACSSGTYIRALARDLGAALGVGGHLTALRRTSVGPFDVGHAGGLDDSLLSSLLDPASVASRLFPTVQLTEDEATALAQGKRPALANLAAGLADHPGPVAAIAGTDTLTGLVSTSGGVARVLVNFPTDEVRGS
jgi:tRNA pseudouridine55 synthase